MSKANQSKSKSLIVNKLFQENIELKKMLNESHNSILEHKEIIRQLDGANDVFLNEIVKILQDADGKVKEVLQKVYEKNKTMFVHDEEIGEVKFDRFQGGWEKVGKTYNIDKIDDGIIRALLELQLNRDLNGMTIQQQRVIIELAKCSFDYKAVAEKLKISEKQVKEHERLGQKRYKNNIRNSNDEYLREKIENIGY